MLAILCSLVQHPSKIYCVRLTSRSQPHGSPCFCCCWLFLDHSSFENCIALDLRALSHQHADPSPWSWFRLSSLCCTIALAAEVLLILSCLSSSEGQLCFHSADCLSWLLSPVLIQLLFSPAEESGRSASKRLWAPTTSCCTLLHTECSTCRSSFEGT